MRRAQVAELVDALGSGPSGGNTVEVRVLSWAPLSQAEQITPQSDKPAGFFVFGAVPPRPIGNATTHVTCSVIRVFILHEHRLSLNDDCSSTQVSARPT
ncbi:hypothetical protein BCAR13_1070029 [Paraburkholderia caribensis]|nr:hypothetical protein BCAR13_1070029 [Paraburkholderia caribensis]